MTRDIATNLLAMAFLIIIVTLIVVACSYSSAAKIENGSVQRVSGTPIYIWHDDQRNVTCYLAWSQSIDCVPDSQLGD